jgi:nicotinamide-nucleotide amidase
VSSVARDAGEPVNSLAGDAEQVASRVIHQLARLGASVATAESLTAGLVSATLATVPGASGVLRGGVVAYATDLKVSLLQVPAALTAERGAVDAQVAAAMASGARRLLAATHAIATTGVAGPAQVDGVPVGTVFVACDGPEGGRVRALHLPGDRNAVRWASVVAALELLLETLPQVRGTVWPAREFPST